MWKDALYALRSFRRNPGFTTVVVISIALGIAANTTVFSIINGLLLGSLPVDEPDRVVSFSSGNTFSYPDYLDYRDQTKDVFDGVAALFPLAPASIGGSGEPERVWGQLVSGDFFSVAGVRTALGRSILAEEASVQGRDAVVVISDSVWRRRFAADPSILGKTIALNGHGYTLVGVAPPGFHGLHRGLVPEFWAPLSMYHQLIPDFANDRLGENRSGSWLAINARLKPGVSRKQAAAAVAVVKARIDDLYFKNDQRRRRTPVTVDAAGGLIDGGDRHAFGLMTVLMAVVSLVLMIACANVANLLLARATARQKEIAIRLSMGAGRRRLIRQLLVESVLLAFIGAAGGFVLAYWAASALSNFQLPLPLPIAFDFTPDLRVLAFTAGLAVVTALLFGLVPAVRATRPDLLPALKNEITGFGGKPRVGVRNGLVIVQVALSLVLLTGSGLFLRSLQNAASIDIGMHPKNVLLMSVDPKLHGYSREKTHRFVSDLRDRVSALPDVKSVSFVDSLPLSIGGSSTDFESDDGKKTNADVYGIGSRFFETMGLPLRRGRDFRSNGDGEDVAIVNETMAQRMFGDRDAIGRQITGRYPPATYTIIGVAGNAKSRTLGESPRACAYLFLEPRAEKVMSFYGISIAVKTNGYPRRLMRAVREQIIALDPNLAVFNTKTMDEHLARSLLLPQVSAILLAVFGAVGLSLAAVGLYGVMSYSVRRRTREFGIRMALGAPERGVLSMVVRQGLLLTGAGVVIGLAAALILSRYAAALLYGVDAMDGVTFSLVPAVLIAVALPAVLFPALRAARAEPMNALRYE